MKYPKQIMRMSELKEMGFPEKWLLSIARRKNNGVAWRDTTKRNSPWYFDTVELEEMRRRACVGGW